MIISQATINKIKNIPIKQVIEQYVDLNRNNSCQCPLSGHDDNDPSFHINTEENYWKCFGCGKSGDSIEFIKLMEGIDFRKAVEKLAEGNVEVEYDSSSNIYNVNDLMGLVEDLKDLENEKIFDDRLVKKYKKHQHKYLIAEGFDKETLEEFDIGFCVDQNDELYNRVTIPWRDYEGNLIAIVGRDVTDNKDAKYKAKRGSDKSNHLYNLNRAKKYADNGLILVEGEKDVMKLWEWGFENAVALGNKELNSRKWLLRKFTNKVHLCLDSDKEGKKAQRKIIPNIYPIINISVIDLSDEYKDIVELDNKEQWLKCWENRKEVKR